MFNLQVDVHHINFAVALQQNTIIMDDKAYGVTSFRFIIESQYWKVLHTIKIKPEKFLGL